MIFTDRSIAKHSILTIKLFSCIILSASFCSLLSAQDDFRVYPYLQNPASNGMTIMWLSEKDSSGVLTYKKEGSVNEDSLKSEPIPAEALNYSMWEDTTFFEDGAPSVPYQHRIRIDSLEPSTTYDYSVQQGESNFRSVFRTAPEGNSSIRFIVYGDSETEPESTGSPMFCGELF